MTIQATCPKGHALALEEKMAGKRIRSQRCRPVIQVTDLDDDEDAVCEQPLRRGARASKDDDEEDRPRAKARRPVEDEDDDDEEEMDPETKRKLERRAKKKQLRLVDIGLLLHLIKLW